MVMNNIFVIPIITTVLFCISKFIEMKYVDKELKPLKYIVRDIVIVFVSSLTSCYLFFHLNLTLDDFMNVITETKSNTANIIGKNAEIFTDNPNF
jgi:hypothetical protein